MNSCANQEKKTPPLAALQGPVANESDGVILMKSVSEFNDEQREDFRLIANDVLGPTMAAYILKTLEQVAYTLAQPDIDPSWIDQEPREKFEVCMAALEYFRMHDAANDRG